MTFAMDKPGLTAEQAKEIVRQYVNEKEGSYIKQQQQAYIKDSNYHKPLPGVIGVPPVLVDLEVNLALVDVFEGVGYVCADSKVFVVDFDLQKKEHKVREFLNLTGKVEQVDRSQPAISCMKAAYLQGAAGHRVLLGENNGRLLVATIKSGEHEIRTFGHATGKITDIIPHVAGTHVAIKYLQAAAGDTRRETPCVAASKAYLALQSSQKRSGTYLEAENTAGNRRSWLSEGYTWSPLVTKECVNGIGGIRWANDELLVQCLLTKEWERYRVGNDALVEIESVHP